MLTSLGFCASSSYSFSLMLSLQTKVCWCRLEVQGVFVLYKSCSYNGFFAQESICCSKLLWYILCKCILSNKYASFSISLFSFSGIFSLYMFYHINMLLVLGSLDVRMSKWRKESQQEYKGIQQLLLWHNKLELVCCCSCHCITSYWIYSCKTSGNQNITIDSTFFYVSIYVKYATPNPKNKFWFFLFMFESCCKDP